MQLPLVLAVSTCQVPSMQSVHERATCCECLTGNCCTRIEMSVTRAAVGGGLFTSSCSPIKPCGGSQPPKTVHFLASDARAYSPHTYHVTKGNGALLCVCLCNARPFLYTFCNIQLVCIIFLLLRALCNSVTVWFLAMLQREGT